MNQQTFENLVPGDVVKHKGISSTVYMVAVNYGTRVTAVAVADITNPPEWDLVMKAILSLPQEQKLE